MEEEKWYVYKHENPYNGKKYIGITKNDPSIRWNNGFGYFNNKPFFHDICKYGWINFGHFIILKDTTKENAKLIESILIYELKTYDEEFGYNNQKTSCSDWEEVEITDYQETQIENYTKTKRNGSKGTPCMCDDIYFPTVKELAIYLGLKDVDVAQMLNPNCVRKFPSEHADKDIRYATEYEINIHQ